MPKRVNRSSRGGTKRTGTQLTDALRRAAMASDDEDEAALRAAASAPADTAGEPAATGADGEAGPAPEGDAPKSTAEQPTYRIGEVAQLVGVDAHVLRYWESEFRLKPQRSPSGQRLYQKDDLAVFLRVKGLLHDEGYTIAGARRVLERGEGAAPGMDVERLKAAITQVKQLRRTIRALQDDIELDTRW